MEFRSSGALARIRPSRRRPSVARRAHRRGGAAPPSRPSLPLFSRRPMMPIESGSLSRLALAVVTGRASVASFRTDRPQPRASRTVADARRPIAPCRASKGVQRPSTRASNRFSRLSTNTMMSVSALIGIVWPDRAAAIAGFPIQTAGGRVRPPGSRREADAALLGSPMTPQVAPQ